MTSMSATRQKLESTSRTENASPRQQHDEPLQSFPKTSLGHQLGMPLRMYLPTLLARALYVHYNTKHGHCLLSGPLYHTNH